MYINVSGQYICCVWKRSLQITRKSKLNKMLFVTQMGKPTSEISGGAQQFCVPLLDLHCISYTTHRMYGVRKYQIEVSMYHANR